MIETRDLVMRLSIGGRPVTILDSITPDIARGQFVAVTGPSGSGRSTPSWSRRSRTVCGSGPMGG